MAGDAARGAEGEADRRRTGPQHRKTIGASVLLHTRQLQEGHKAGSMLPFVPNSHGALFAGDTKPCTDMEAAA